MFSIHPVLLPDALCFLNSKCFRQEVQQVLRPSLGGWNVIVGMTDLVAKEHHLQIEVVEETPTAEILNGLFPFIPVRHIQQTSLSERMHKGSVSVDSICTKISKNQ